MLSYQKLYGEQRYLKKIKLTWGSMLVGLCLLSCLLACGPKVDKTQGGQQTARSQVSLKCVPIPGNTEEDIFRYMVYLEDGGQSQPVMMIPVCSLLDPAAYTDHQVPAEAITAVSSWWAGSGDYLYAMETEAGILFRRAVVDEMQLVRDYGYMDWALWQGGTLITYENSMLMPKSGLYTTGGHDGSYLLLLDKVNDQWQAEALKVDGMLPPREDLWQEIEGFALQPIADFTFDPSSGNFSAGDWGKGQLVSEEGRHYLVFEQKENAAGEPLRMEWTLR